MLRYNVVTPSLEGVGHEGDNGGERRDFQKKIRNRLHLEGKTLTGDSILKRFLSPNLSVLIICRRSRKDAPFNEIMRGPKYISKTVY